MDIILKTNQTLHELEVVYPNMVALCGYHDNTKYKLPYKQNYWRTLYLVVYSKNAIGRIFDWRF